MNLPRQNRTNIRKPDQEGDPFLIVQYQLHYIKYKRTCSRQLYRSESLICSYRDKSTAESITYLESNYRWLKVIRFDDIV